MLHLLQDSVEAQMDPDTKALREIRRLVLGRPLVNRDSLVVSPTTKDKAATNRLSTGNCGACSLHLNREHF